MTRPRHNSAGFTLAELVVAIAILGVGMTMAAALFPAAVKQLEYAMRDITGTVICQRGLDVARTVLDPNGSDIPTLDLSSPDSGLSSWFVADPNHITARFGDPDNPNCALYYDPHHEGRTNKGFVLLARRVSANPSDGYMMLVAAYWRKVSTGTIAAVRLTGDLVAAGDTRVINGAACLQVGSPFIDATTGQFAIITAVSTDQSSGTLDRPINNLAGGRATSGSPNAIADTTKAWASNYYQGCSVGITAGTGAGQTGTITGNSANTLTVNPAWSTVPDSTSYYTIWRPCTSAWVVWQSNMPQDSPVIGTMQRTVQLR